MASLGHVSLRVLPAGNFAKERHCLSLGYEVVVQFLAAGPDTSPSSNEGRLAKECWLYRQRIIARHVLNWIYPLKIEAGAALSRYGG
ncbi:hypothetical protein D3C72_2333900 [compost metagenome]